MITFSLHGCRCQPYFCASKSPTTRLDGVFSSGLKVDCESLSRELSFQPIPFQWQTASLEIPLNERWTMQQGEKGEGYHFSFIRTVISHAHNVAMFLYALMAARQQWASKHLSSPYLILPESIEAAMQHPLGKWPAFASHAIDWGSDWFVIGFAILCVCVLERKRCHRGKESVSQANDRHCLEQQRLHAIHTFFGRQQMLQKAENRWCQWSQLGNQLDDGGAHQTVKR